MKITIEIDAEIAENLNLLIKNLSSAPVEGSPKEEFNSHGRLTISSLAKMLLEDAAMAISRPGSWESSNMIDVLRAHGYEVG